MEFWKKTAFKTKDNAIREMDRIKKSFKPLFNSLAVSDTRSAVKCPGLTYSMAQQSLKSFDHPQLRVSSSIPITWKMPSALKQNRPIWKLPLNNGV